MSRRTDQLASTIHRAVQGVLARGLNDPRVRGLISVTRVEVLQDMSEARVFVSILPEEATELSMHGLHHAAPHVQHAVAQQVPVRRLPQLVFRLDESLKKQARVDAAIAEGLRRDAQRGDASGPVGAETGGEAPANHAGSPTT
jgi:ribosome-binding factor A